MSNPFHSSIFAALFITIGSVLPAVFVAVLLRNTDREWVALIVAGAMAVITTHVAVAQSRKP